MDRQIFAQLRDDLAHLYPNYNDAVRIVHDTGLSITRIANEGSAINRWHAILSEAENANRVAEMLHVVSTEYDRQKSLQDLYLAYRRGRQEITQKEWLCSSTMDMPVSYQLQKPAVQIASKRFIYRTIYTVVVTLALLLVFNHEKILSATSAALRTNFTVINSSTGNVSNTITVIDPVISPDNKRLATIGPDGTVSLLDLSTGIEISRFHYETIISTLQFSPDSTRLIIITSDGIVHIWDGISGERLTILQHDAKITETLLSPDDTRLLTTDVNGAVYLWDVNRGNEIQMNLHHAQIKTSQFSSNGKYLAITDTDGALYLFNHNGKRLSTLSHLVPIQNLRFSPDGTRLATTDGSGAFSLWDINNGKQLAYTYRITTMNEFYFSPDSSRLVTVEQVGDAVSKVQLWNSSSGRPIAAYYYRVKITQIQFSPDSTYLAVAGNNRRADLSNASSGIVYLINSVKGEQVTQLQHANALNNILFSPDSTQLATAAIGGTVYLWQTSNGAPMLHFAHNDTATKMLFSTNGDRLITATTQENGDNVYLWNMIDGRSIQQFHYTTHIKEINFINRSIQFVIRTESTLVR